MSRPVRVRFAPSPTGFLHIGGVRSALFNWLYARHHKGQFIVRIEDTDLERSEDRFTQDIYASLKWLGIISDEEPIFQSKRLGLYLEKAKELVAHDHAYWCYCSEADVEQMRVVATAAGKRAQYNRHCRDLKLPEPKVGQIAVIRAKVPLDGYTEFDDMIRGPIRIENTEVDDFVLIRSNLAPTYNLSVVVDDVGSRMTHIIRGEEHVNNTPKQIHLYNYFNYEIPRFAHLPLILGPDKKKLSKRHGAVSANVYRAEGYLAEAMINFLVRLGWSHGDQEIFSVDELIEFFDFDHVSVSSGVFNPEKLLWLNGEYMRKAEPARLAAIVADEYPEHFAAAPGSLAKVKTQLGAELVKLIQAKVKLTKEVAEQLVPLCTTLPVEVDASGLKWNKDPAVKTAVKAAVKHATDLLAKKIAAVPPVKRTGADAVWGTSPALVDAGMTHTDVDAFLKQIGEETGVKLGDLAQPMRLTVTGRMVSAGLFDLLAIMPWDVVEPRLRKIETL